MVTGTFPDYIMRQFESMLDYFGQSPIIVRSSSLLEDNFGNAFAGKYESVFCANQGPRHKRLEDFLTAVKTIYASTMSEKALTYRSQRGLLDKDEQMALLVQRVSGGSYGSLYYPQIAGVGFSFNPYVWSHYIDPEAGMLRLVFGLGTRAVDRSDDDYTRVVALNAPDRRCESNFDEVRQYAQRRVDVLDLEANQLVSSYFSDVVARSRRLPIEMFADVDEDLQRRSAEPGRREAPPYVLTFNRLFRQTNFVGDMRDMLAILEKAYDYPVDVEFTANFAPDGGYRINLVQCRPFQVRGGGTVIELPTDIPRQNMLLEAHGAVIGQSRMLDIDRFLYVVPSVYGQLPIVERYAVARLIGRVMQADRGDKARNIMLLGPGRWGTTTPSLGVPVKFGDINGVSVLCEIVAMRDDLVPDVSLGTHFFNELVELDMLYLALFPTREDNFLNRTFFESAPSRLTDLVPDAEQWAKVVRVIDLADLPGRCARLHADTLSQKVVCYLK
jgi:pyruvate,water dikinase